MRVSLIDDGSSSIVCCLCLICFYCMDLPFSSHRPTHAKVDIVHSDNMPGKDGEVE